MAICQGVCRQDSSVGWGLDAACGPIPTLKFYGFDFPGGISDTELARVVCFPSTVVVMEKVG